MKKPRLLLIIAALVLLALGVGLVLTTRAPTVRGAPSAAPTPQGGPATATTTAVRGSTPATPPTVEEPEEQEPQNAALPEKEIYVTDLPPGDGGIYVFNKPGTKPIKDGIIVPEGFELPPGYVRHFQHTDDGEDVPPILMFHPDHKLFDAAGHPVPLPPDLIVPPELAPKGMPIRMLGQVPVRPDFDEKNQPIR